MAQMVDTQLPGKTDERLLRAFLYGIIDGEYKIYTSDEETLSIWFKQDEEATLFVMRELEEEFKTNFLSTDDELNDLLRQLQKIPLTSPPVGPYTSPSYPWQPHTIVGPNSIDDWSVKQYTVTCDSSDFSNTMAENTSKLV